MEGGEAATSLFMKPHTQTSTKRVWITMSHNRTISSTFFVREDCVGGAFEIDYLCVESVKYIFLVKSYKILWTRGDEKFIMRNCFSVFHLLKVLINEYPM